MLIDAHQHFWRIGRNAHSWPTPDLTAIHRDFGPEDWTAVAAPLGFTGSVLVQSQPSDRDTDWLLDVAAVTETVKAVVGWTDLLAPDASERIALLARRPKLRGLRPMLQNLPADDWIVQPALAPAIEAMLARGLSLDALVFTRHLPHLRIFAQRWPQLPIVIDHAAKPPIAVGELDPWREEIAACAALPNVVCKLSGLLTEAAPEQGSETLATYVAHLIAAFGPERLMWGSDWPVLKLAGDFAGWFATADSLADLRGPERARLFGGTAASFYRI